MLATAVSNILAESRTNKFPFMGWRPFTLRKPLCAYGLIAQLVQRSALTERAPTTSPRHPVGALSISGRLSWRPLSCAPSMGIDLEVGVLPRAGHNERSEPQSVVP